MAKRTEKPAPVAPLTLSQALEAAMGQAVMDAYAEGISDPKVHLERKMAARERVKAEWKAAGAKGAEA